MIIHRRWWQQAIEGAWCHKNIVWLMGVRRVGKTTLCRSLSDIEYFDCERSRVRQLFADPEEFLASKSGKRVVLDEVHRLDNPSEILKLAADYYPDVNILATGSSTLGASAKFKDTLTGRKRTLWLTPLFLEEMNDFGNQDIRHRFLFGGLPSFFSASLLPEDDFQEWIDSYWAKDIVDMFKVEKRYSFQKFAELLLAHSGGQFEATRFARACEVSRQTIANYLSVLEATLVIHLVRPYSTHKATEIVMAPKVYGFDSGFVCYAKGWRELRREDTGLLWEHCVLNELHGHLQTRHINYWRTKQGHEIDFVVPALRDNQRIAIECKFNVSTLGGSGLASIKENMNAFRRLYPHGENYVVARDIDVSYSRRLDNLTIHFVNTKQLIERITLPKSYG